MPPLCSVRLRSRYSWQKRRLLWHKGVACYVVRPSAEIALQDIFLEKFYLQATAVLTWLMISTLRDFRYPNTRNCGSIVNIKYMCNI